MTSRLFLSHSGLDAALAAQVQQAIEAVFAADAFAGSPSACQFFMWTKAPNAGLNRRLQAAAALAFHSAGATCPRTTSATSDFGGA